MFSGYGNAISQITAAADMLRTARDSRVDDMHDEWPFSALVSVPSTTLGVKLSREAQAYTTK